MNDKDMLYKWKGQLVPVYIGIDLANGKDKSVMIPPGKKNEKTPCMGRTGSR